MKKIIVWILVLGTLALSACASKAEPTPLPATATPAALITTPKPTATPIPPTPTPLADPGYGLLSEQLYISEAYGYEITYPAGWTLVEMADMLVLVDDPTSLSTNIPTRAAIISAGPLDSFLGGSLAGAPLESAGPALLAVVPQLLGSSYQLGEFEELSLRDIPAIGAPFNGVDETGVSILGYIALTISGDRAAILLGSAPEDLWPAYEPVFSAMLDTFSFINP